MAMMQQMMQMMNMGMGNQQQSKSGSSQNTNKISGGQVAVDKQIKGNQVESQAPVVEKVECSGGTNQQPQDKVPEIQNEIGNQVQIGVAQSQTESIINLSQTDLIQANSQNQQTNNTNNFAVTIMPTNETINKEPMMLSNVIDDSLLVENKSLIYNTNIITNNKKEMDCETPKNEKKAEAVIDLISCSSDKKENLSANLLNIQKVIEHETTFENNNNNVQKNLKLAINPNNSTPANVKKTAVESEQSTNIDTTSSKKAAPIDNFFSSFNISFE